MNALDLAYFAAVAVTAPLWLAKPATRQKVRRAWQQRMGRDVQSRVGHGPAVWVHAVSVGELNATPALVAQLQSAEPDLHVIVSSTSETGFARAQKLYGGKPNLTTVRFPLDLSAAVGRLLDALRPELVVLMELELWPNFLRACAARQIPVMVINGRMTGRSFARYRLVRFVIAPILARLAAVCVQEQIYADHFIALGADSDRVHITGTMKFDTAQLAERVAGDDALAAAVGLPVLDPQRPVWVSGSTGPGEEAIVLRVYQQLLVKRPALRLVIVPRHPERFDAVADEITAAGFALVRRSRPGPLAPNAVVLGDTMGELRAFYSLASVVFVGRSLLDLGSRQRGSDMIEPAALAKPVAVGPWTQNFAEVIRTFLSAEAMIEVADAAQLAAAIERWLDDPSAAAALGKRAQSVVAGHRGATARHAKMIHQILEEAEHGTPAE